MSETLAIRVRNISRIVYVVISLLVFVGDQATKYMVETSIPEREVIPVIPGFFNLTHVKNVGAAFGLFADSPAPSKKRNAAKLEKPRASEVAMETIEYHSTEIVSPRFVPTRSIALPQIVCPSE